MKNLILTFLIFLIITPAHAQKKGQELIDSLQTALSKAGQDTNRVNALNGLSEYAGWRVGNYDTAAYYAQNALKLAQQLNDKKGKAGAYRNIAAIYYSRGDYPEALKNYTTALKLFQAIGDKRRIASCYGNIGVVYWSLGDYPKALKNDLVALKLDEAIGDKTGIVRGYNNIGIIYTDQGNLAEALKNYISALKIAESIGDKREIAYCHNDIGLIYCQQGKYPEALKNYTTTLKIARSIGDKSEIALCYINIGGIYTYKGDYRKALENDKAALKIDKSIGDKTGTARCCINIGSFYMLLNNAKEGKAWLQKGLALSQEIGAKGLIKNSYSGLAHADSALGNFKSAFSNYKMYVLYKDSLVNKANTKKLTQTAMQYQFDKKQLADSLKNVQVRKLAAEKLSKQKGYTAMGAGLAAVLLFFSALFFRNNKKLDKEKKKSDNLLLNILPTEVADELKEKGSAEAKQFDEVSVLFTDFVNFTKTSEKLSPHELVQELNECFTAFDNIIERNGLEKIKTVGDAYMAVCGLPTADPRHAQRTVQAALDIRSFMEDRKQHEQVFDIRIGINSGSVVAGIVGVKKFAYDIWGDTVNTAARMEENSEAGQVNISDATYRLVQDEFECTYRGKVEAKGKGEVDMYFVNS